MRRWRSEANTRSKRSPLCAQHFLEATLVGTKKFFGTDATTADIALGMSGDLHEHLGQLIAYARVNGIKPPWTK